MPRTPPLILPNNLQANWFNSTANEKEPTTTSTTYSGIDFQLLNTDLSSFSYSPSDDDELSSEKEKSGQEEGKVSCQPLSQQNNHNHQENGSHDTTMDTLYRHTPLNSHHASRNNSQQYQLLDDDDDDIQIADGERHEGEPMHTQNTEGGANTFDSAVEELQSDFKLYTAEYKEFKRYVDNAKRELLTYIQERSEYFEQRGSYLSQKWESLKGFI